MTNPCSDCGKPMGDLHTCSPQAPAEAVPDYLAPEDDAKAKRRCKCEFSGGGVNAKKCSYHDRLIADLRAQVEQLQREIENLEDSRRMLRTAVTLSNERAEQAESECQEQARLNGMGSEREAALMGEVEQLQRERDEMCQILKTACDRAWKDETPIQIANIAANGLYWRNRRAEQAEQREQLLQQELDAANTRLENNSYWKDGELITCKPGSIPDGIYCRDETIKLLSNKLDESGKREQAAREEVKQAETHIRNLLHEDTKDESWWTAPMRRAKKFLIRNETGQARQAK